jgi:hypothetical protein
VNSLSLIYLNFDQAKKRLANRRRDTRRRRAFGHIESEMPLRYCVYGAAFGRADECLSGRAPAGAVVFAAKAVRSN